MSLLSPVLVVVLVALVAGSAAAAIWSWPRLARPGAARVLGRLGVLLGVNVSVLLLASALLNDQYQFFTDWADVAGAFSAQGAPTDASSSSAGGAASAAVTVPVDAARATVPDATSVVVSRGAESTTYAVTGAVSGVTSQVLVVLPSGYGDPANAGRRYPVLMGFGGYPGSVSQLERAFRVPDTLASLDARHVLAPAIAVFLQPWTPPGRDTECVDGPGGPPAGDQVETWAAVDVPAWVSSHFRTRPGRTSWATWGVSAGAWCASMVAMLHPDRFGAAISIGGYFRPDWGNWHPFAAGSASAQRYDLVAAAARRPPPVALWLYASTHDSLAYPDSLALMKAARPPFSVTARIGTVGGHGYVWWTPWLPVALGWLAHVAPGFAPPA